MTSYETRQKAKMVLAKVVTAKCNSALETGATRSDVHECLNAMLAEFATDKGGTARNVDTSKVAGEAL